MKVLICSDIHGILFYTKKLEELINRENVDKIVILGDVYYYGPRSIKEDTYIMIHLKLMVRNIL